MKKDMIKAVRLVRGLNPDLRVKLTTINRSALYDWIEENRYGILGVDHPSEALIKPDGASQEWKAYERMIWKAVDAVIFGTAE